VEAILQCYLLIKIADKVNAQGETIEARLDASDGRIDEAIIQGMHHGVALGLAAMSTQVRKDFSVMPVGFVSRPQKTLRTLTSSWRAMMTMQLSWLNPQMLNLSSTDCSMSSLYLGIPNNKNNLSL
jgi:peptide deformylase